MLLNKETSNYHHNIQKLYVEKKLEMLTSNDAKEKEKQRASMTKV